MAFGALLSLQNTLENCILQDQFHIFHADDEVKQPLRVLLQNITVLRKFLENFPRKARKYEVEINDSAHELESTVEYFVSDTISQGKVSDVENEKRLIRDINKVGAKMETIVQEAVVMMETGSKTNTEDEESLSVRPLSKVEFRLSGKEKLVGLDDYIRKLKDDIFSVSRELVIIPIVGMGGIGKTTLARAVFDYPSVARRFDIRRWLTISQNCNLRATLLSLLDDKAHYDAMDLVDLSVEVHKMLKKRRYLIAVDDIWSLNAWDDIKRSLPDDLNGSRILLTTRDYEVANYAISSNAICNLEFMDMESSWRLLEQRVFGDEGCCPVELVDIGKTIAEGCRGLPLAIIVIAGILSHIAQTPNAWESIANDVSGALITDDGQFTEILALSYYHLPTHLKPCFLYFGAFPEDYDIKVMTLCKLWVSEGFLNAGKGNSTEDAEEIAYGWVEDLVKGNLIMCSRKLYNGRIKRCKIHDLMRDFCIRRAREEKFLNHIAEINVEGITNARRVSFASDISPLVMNASYCTSSIHTALCFRHYDSFMSSLHCLRLLRVMDAVTIVFDEFPTQLLQLYHLRYLAICYNGDVPLKIPAEVNQLGHLETLILKQKRSLHTQMVTVPSAILRMKKLRHLKIQSFFPYPDSIGWSLRLENLKTLSSVYNIRFEQRTVESIPSVKKLIVLCYLNHDEKWSDYFLHNIRHLGYLETLKFWLQFKRYDTEWCKQNPFLDSIVFPSSLKRLTIRGCAARIPWEDMSRVIGSLPNLEELKLSSFVCNGDVWESKEEEFQNLRVIEIIGSDLRCWKTENDNTHFPNLEILILNFCSNLIEIPDCIGDIPTLQLICLDGNHKSVSQWASRTKEEQDKMGDDRLIIWKGIDSIQGITRELIDENERLSPEDVAERLAVWAGDDEQKRQQAERVGITYLMSSEIDVVGGPDSMMTQLNTFMTCLNKRL